MKNRSIFLASLLLSGAVAPVVQGDEAAENELETIVVTGTRQAYRGEFDRLETPLAEQILDLELIESAGAVDFISALDLSASVARQNNFGGLWNSFAVRGFVGDENLPSNYLVNGFNAGRGFAGPRDISGIESIEVLKGPKAALFGRGEPGGTINVVTKRPDFEQRGQVRASAGRFDTLRADADVNLPLSDTVALRLVGFTEDADSFRDTIETQRHGFTPSVLWQLNEDTQVVYELEYTEQEIPFDRGVVAINNDLGAVDIETFLGEPGNGPMEAEVVGHQIEIQHELNEDWSALFGFNYRDTSLEGFDTAATLSGGRQFLLRDGQNLSRERRFRDYDAEYYVLRGEFSGSFELGNTEHRVIFGLDYDEFKNDQVFMRARGGSIQAGELATDPAAAQRLQVINVFNPVYGQFPLPQPGPQTNRLDQESALGFFVQDQITLTDQLDIRVGFRYDEYHQERLNRRNNSESDNSDSQVSPQLGVVYRLNEETAIYASYGEGLRPLLGTEPNGDQLEPNATESF
jgi:iron complex outermembrane receptor protein